MARPQTVTDDEILQAAQLVIERRGHEGFTLSEVAEEVGLSRAAITLRFKSALALKRRLLEKNVERFEVLLGTLPATASGDSLLEVAALLGRIVGLRDNYAVFLGVYSGNMKIEELADIERKRGAALAAAIARCMPETSVSRDQAVHAFIAHISGSMMSWQGRQCQDPGAYLVERAKQWLTLAHIPFSEDFKGVWMTVQSAPIEATTRRAHRPRRAAG